MHLYQGTTRQFIADAGQARLASRLSERFFEEFRHKPAPSEVMSWQNSLAAMGNVLKLADLTDQGILVELKLPLSSKRLDVLITGSNPGTEDAAVIVELKQWTTVGLSIITDCLTVAFGGDTRSITYTPRARLPSTSGISSTRTLHSPTAESRSTVAPTSTTLSTTRVLR